MTKQQIARECKKKTEQLLDAHLMQIAQQAQQLSPDMLLADYSAKITQQIEDEYREYLKNMWQEHRGNDKREFYEIMEKAYTRLCIDSMYRNSLRLALKDAQTVTLWEKLTNTNYKDIEHFTSLLRDYVSAILLNMTMDFVEEF